MTFFKDDKGEQIVKNFILQTERYTGLVIKLNESGNQIVATVSNVANASNKYSAEENIAHIQKHIIPQLAKDKTLVVDYEKQKA